MRLLVITQAVDLDDPVLGFFHGWIESFAKYSEAINVICLYKGRHTLDTHIPVHSLGKEEGASRLTRALRLLSLAWSLRGKYDVVFVHMNQEYVLLAGWLWKLLGKRVYLWRNHYQPHAFTGLASRFCTKMFCTSKYSYITKYKKTILMPIGVDTAVFKPVPDVGRTKDILFLGRIAPSKHAEVLIEALSLLKQKGVTVGADIYGDASPRDEKYKNDLAKRVKELGLEHSVYFYPALPNAETPKLYSAYELFVNCSGNGMYDKTIFEALACGALAIASSRDYAEIADTQLSFDGTAAGLSETLTKLLAPPGADKQKLSARMRETVVQKNSLVALTEQLFVEMSRA